MYNQKVLDIFKNPLNAGGLQGANGVAKVVSDKFGDVVRIYLKINENEVIENARFKTMGCVATIVVSNVLCDLVKGKTLEEAKLVTAEDVVEILGQLPEQKVALIGTVFQAFRDAVSDYYKRKQREQEINNK